MRSERDERVVERRVLARVQVVDVREDIAARPIGGELKLRGQPRKAEFRPPKLVVGRVEGTKVIVPTAWLCPTTWWHLGLRLAKVDEAWQLFGEEVFKCLSAAYTEEIKSQIERDGGD